MSVKIRKNGAWVTIGGDKGEKGDKGFKGDKGNVDDKGNKGDKGLKGDKGDKGNDGGVGNKGDKGEKGLKGDEGLKGDKGNKGDKGLKGDVEEKGNKGEKGEVGEKGDNKGSKGDKGQKGLKGDVEEKGNKGDKGIKGDNKGEKGQKGTKGEKGAVEDKGNKGDEGDKGDKGNVDDKGNKGEQGQKGNKGEFKGQKGEKGDVEAVGNKGQKGEKGQFKGDKGDAGQKGAIDEKGNKGEPGTGGVTINNDVNDYVLTATGNPSVIQAESRLRFDPTGRLDIYAGTGDTHIEMGHGANNQYAYLDLIGDTSYTDFGARIIRGNTGANTFSQVAHRGTGELQFIAQDNGAMKFFGNHFGFRNTSRIINSLNGYGSANSGFRLITNVFTGWPFNGTAYSYDTGISVNQGNGGGCLLVMFSNTHNPGINGEHALYLVRLWDSGNGNPTAVAIVQTSTFYKATFGKSSQNTVVITGQKGGNYVTIMAAGGMVL